MAGAIQFDCVAAADAAGGIGKHNDLPWPRLSEDLRFLRRITTEAAPGKLNAVIMGRLTWESVPSGRQPLPGRLNVVVSRSALALPSGMLGARSLEQALVQARARPEVDGLFVIGGAQIFRQAFSDPGCRHIYITRIAARFDCDTFLPPLPAGAVLSEVLSRHREHGIDYEIQRWTSTASTPAGSGVESGA
jgi:dihydrofolate reductase